MSSRKSKLNDENLCPIASKRAKSTTNSAIKIKSKSNFIETNLESTSSPTDLSNEYLEEMGVVLLDSEESSASVSSVISFAAALSSISSNIDENCNEKCNATPNLDAPKCQYPQRTDAYRSLDQTADNSTDGIESFTESNEAQIGSNNNTFEIFTDESSQQGSLPVRKSWIQHKILSESPDDTSVGSGRKRSPLATVTCNSQQHKVVIAQQHQQQPLQQHTKSRRQADGNIPSTQNQQQELLNLSPSQPSTSQQAAFLKQQQQLHQLQTQKRLHLSNKESNQKKEIFKSESNSQKLDDFFLFRNRQMRESEACSDKTDYFSLLSDEIILQILKWLPKKTLLRCGSVCRRFQQCSADDSLWTRLDLGNRSLRPEVMDHILSRGVVILRLAQANLREPVFQNPCPNPELKGQSKLQYLDLSLAQIDKPSLKTLLSYCRQLKKLSLEHVPLNNDICNEIAENTHLEALNLAMCTGLEAWSVRKMLEPLKNLNSLNISWTNLSVDAVTALVTHVTPNLMRLNVAGCRKSMFDTHVASLAKRCPQLLELDLSDCTGLTGNVITILCNFKMLEYLSLSRCYLIPAMTYLELKNLSSLAFLDVFGTLSDPAMDLLGRTFPGLGINKFVHSSVARPTVGTRRTSIWGLRTRD